MMTKIDYTIGFTVTEVEEILTAQKAELKKVLQAHSDSGTSVTKRRVDEIHAIIAACQSALQKLDPITYPPRGRNAMQSVVDGYLPK